MISEFSVIGIPNIPMIEEGDDLVAILSQAIARAGLQAEHGDVLCIAQKIVSKAEARHVTLAKINPGTQALALAEATGKDPRMVQLILDESDEVLRHKTNVLIVRHKLGIVGAHAGIDQSNIDHQGDERALLLPENPDRSAAEIRAGMQARWNTVLGVIITDSHNRPWRMGTLGCAIGAAGVKILEDHRGGEDIYGRSLQATLVNRADALANTATLVMGETTEKLPAVIIRGLPPERTLSDDAQETAALINRPLNEDLFR